MRLLGPRVCFPEFKAAPCPDSCTISPQAQPVPLAPLDMGNPVLTEGSLGVPRPHTPPHTTSPLPPLMPEPTGLAPTNPAAGFDPMCFPSALIYIPGTDQKPQIKQRGSASSYIYLQRTSAVANKCCLIPQLLTPSNFFPPSSVEDHGTQGWNAQKGKAQSACMPQQRFNWLQ